jgi:hypothetical protein
MDLTLRSRHSLSQKARRRSALEESIVIRRATQRDDAAVARLAALDSHPVPRGTLLLAVVDGELRAAMALAGGALVANPFKPSEPLAALLRLRASQEWAINGQVRPGRDSSSPRRVLRRLAEGVQA